MVVAITYLSLIVGELVPTQIAPRAPEQVAAKVAPMMRIIARIAAPLIWVLDRSGKLVLRFLGQSGKRETGVSDEEIRMVIAEAESAGVIEKGETAMIAGVMRVADRSARGIMTARHEVEIAEAGETSAEILARFHRSGHSRLPLRCGGPDDIVGVLNSHVLMQVKDEGFDARAHAQPAPIIHDALPAMAVIERLKDAPGHMLLVYDEYGHFEGIITPLDILGAIAGGFDETDDDEPKIVEREDGSLLVSGWMPLDEFAEGIGVTMEADPDYETVAGLVLHLAEELPQVGQSVMVGDWRIEVVDMDGRRIDKLLVQRMTAPK